MTNQPARPAEWLHDRRCLANAVINAVENLRDVDSERGEGDAHEERLAFHFRLAMQNGEALSNADYYLREGMLSCRCPQPWPEPPPCTHEAGMVPDDEAGWWVCELGCGHHTAPGTNTPPRPRNWQPSRPKS